MNRNFIKRILLLIGVLTVSLYCFSDETILKDRGSNVSIRQNGIQNSPKVSSILAFIDGHVLTVSFTENLGEVVVEITTASGGTVDLTDIWTPNSYIAYIPNTGNYVVTITLENGDEYYGEFEVTE